MVNQVQGDYLAKDLWKVAYLDKVKNISMKIKYFKIRQIPREENKKANALANLVSTFDFILDRSIPMEFLPVQVSRSAKLFVEQNMCLEKFMKAYLGTTQEQGHLFKR